MTSFVSGDSVFHDGTPIFNSALVVENSKGGVNIDTRSDEGVNLYLEGDGENVVYTSLENDFIASGHGDDIINASGGDDYIEGSGGKDIIRGGVGDDVIRGGKDADVLMGGSGYDTFIIKGDSVDGAYGADSDLTFDAHGKVIADAILDFNDSEDYLVLQDMQVNGVGSVSYDSDTGDVTLTDSADPDAPKVIAKLQPGLDISVIDQGDGNWTLL